MLSVKQGSIKYHFWVFDMTRPGIKPRSSGPLMKHSNHYANNNTKMGRKTIVWTFQATNKRNITRENLDMTLKGKPLERNWISSDSSTKQRHKNYVKVRIDKTQQNCRCRLCGDRDETINHIISEINKLAQKEYKTRRDWVGKVNCTRSLNLTKLPNSICTTLDLS